MKTSLSKACFGISAALLLCATPAAAEDSAGADAVTTAKVPRSDVQVGSHAGVFRAAEGGGPMLGIQARYRRGPFEVGGFGEYGSEILDASHIGFGATAGLAWRSSFGLRLAASGAFGVHVYEGVGRGFLSSDPGADGSTLFAGARASASYLFLRGENHIELGMMGLYDGDLTRQNVTVHYLEQSWLSNDTYEATSTHTIGTDRFGALITLGWTRDLI